MSRSMLEAEIAAQPTAVRDLLEAEAHRVDRLAARWRARGDLTGVMLAARGTSDNAARYGQYVLGAYNQLPVALATPSLFTRYQRPPRLDGLLVVAVSQSGRSPDVVGVLAEANRQGRPTLAITNDASSPLALEADALIGLHAGDERAVAATKTYTTSLGAIALLSVSLGDDDGRRAELAGVPDALEAAVAGALAAVDVPAWLRDAPACAVIGRGYNYATAHEIALKLKELTGLAAEAYSSADFLHGPVAAISWDVPVLLIAPTGVVFDDLAGLVDALRDRGASLVIVSDDAELLDRADLPLPVRAGTPEWLSPFPCVVPGQVLAWRLADARGLDVDRPAGLQKVTETR